MATVHQSIPGDVIDASMRTDVGVDKGDSHDQHKPDKIMATVQQSLPGDVIDASMRTELGDDHKKGKEHEGVHFGSDEEQSPPVIQP